MKWSIDAVGGIIIFFHHVLQKLRVHCIECVCPILSSICCISAENFISVVAYSTRRKTPSQIQSFNAKERLIITWFELVQTIFTSVWDNVIYHMSLFGCFSLSDGFTYNIVLGTRNLILAMGQNTTARCGLVLGILPTMTRLIQEHGKRHSLSSLGNRMWIPRAMCCLPITQRDYWVGSRIVSPRRWPRVANTMKHKRPRKRVTAGRNAHWIVSVWVTSTTGKHPNVDCIKASKKLGARRAK